MGGQKRRPNDWNGMKALRYFAIASCLALALPAQAIVSNCFPPIATHSPVHPGIGDRIDVHFTWAVGYRYGTTYYVSEPTQSGSELSFNVLVAGDTAPAGFRKVGKEQYDDFDTVFASLGPLPLGDYSVRIKMNELVNGVVSPVCGESVLAFTVRTEPGVTQTSAVVEYYHAALDHYFVTQNPAEMADLDSGVHLGWTRTGYSFAAYLPGKSDARGNPVCRWYASPGNVDSHFFSASSIECNHVNTYENGRIWQSETDDAFEMPLPDLTTGECRTGTVPVYRLWNGRLDSNHRYTTSRQVQLEMIAKGYVAEGYGPNAVAMCAPQ